MSATVVSNNNLFAPADIMEVDSFQNMEKYDKIVREACASGMSIEQAVQTADACFAPENLAVTAAPFEFCIYIPRVRIFTPADFIKEQLAFLGEIKRVDFVRIKDFLTKTVDTEYKRAFVHFRDIAPNSGNAARVMEAIEATGQYAFSPSTFDEIWYLQYAENPIEDTELNIHQLANNYNIIDDKVIDMEQELFRHNVMTEQLQDKCDSMEEQVRNLQETTISLQLYVQRLEERIAELVARPYPANIVSDDDDEEDETDSADSEFMLRSSRM